MNYLAHLFLAEESDEAIIGNFLGDFVKGRLTDQYNKEILKGIAAHRKVDAFTDSHKIVRASRRLISDKRRRWSGIIIDILYDHFLTINWNQYTDRDQDKFINDMYDVLEKYIDIVPEPAKKIIPSIISNNWLVKYRTVDGLSLVFERMSNRINVLNELSGAEEELMDNYEKLNENFNLFFPQLLSMRT